MSTINAENNDKAILLSEEVEFLEVLLTDFELTPDAVSAILERRDIVRDAMRTGIPTSPTASAEEGITTPPDTPPDMPSEDMDPDDAIEVTAEDKAGDGDDHTG